MTLFDHRITGIQWQRLHEVRDNTEQTIQLVQGNFRQHDILRDWSAVPDSRVLRVQARATVSAGTYIRSIVHTVGTMIGCPTVTTHIKRVGIGNLNIADITTPPEEIPLDRLREKSC